MKPYIANLINGLVLIGFGLATYFLNETRPPTALIAPAFGLIFLLSTPMMKKENKVVAHIVVLLTLLIIIALAGKPLIRNIEEGNTINIVLIGGMILTSIFSMVTFIKSFIDARKARG